MTVEECYIKMGANYQDVIKRLPSVSMIEKFALKTHLIKQDIDIINVK